MNLPDMTGPNVSEALNAKSGIHCPKIVAFTASSSEIHKQKCFESGMIGFISKPVSQSGLADGIRRAQNISLDTKKDAG